MLSLNRFIAVLTSVVAISYGVVAGPASAVPSPPSAGTTDPGTRPDEASAVSAARSSGRPVEVTGATDETTRRWANPNGTFTDEVYAAPVRTRRDGGWVPIDTTLAVRDGAVRPAATVGDVHFSAGGNTRLASVTTGGAEVALRWPRPLPVPVLDGNVATYADVLPGVDIEMKAVTAGYEQSFILKNAAAAAAVRGMLRVPLSTTGVTPVHGEHGISFRDAGGVDRAWITAARMWDSAGREAPVGVAIVNTRSGRVIEMTPDAELMADPSLVYPVTVDPTVTVSPYRDAYISSGAQSTNYGSNAYLKIGLRGTSTYITYIEFPMANYAGKQIVDVTQSMGVTDSVTCSAKTTTIYKVTSEWFQSTVTWDDHPVTDATSNGTLATATSAGGGPTGSSCAANAWMQFNDSRLTAQYQAWADDDSTNYGMSIRASSSDSQAAKDFASADNTSWTPRISITYNNYPAGAAGRYVTPATVESDGTRVTPTTTPTLAAYACDPDGSATRVDFEVWNATKTTLLQSSPTTESTVPSCQRKQWTVTSPLTHGTTYYWRARGYDGSVYSKTWTPWSTLVVDTQAPPAPSISSTTFTANQWLTATAPSPTSYSFGLSASPSTDVTGYYYSIDNPNPSTYTTASSVSFDIAEGWHTVYVQSADRARNRSSVTSFSFGYGHLAVTSPTDGARSSQKFTLSASANPSVGSLTWKRVDASGSLVALTELKDLSNNTVTQPVTVTSGSVPTLVWDAETELGTSATDGPIQLTAVVRTTAAPTVDVATRTLSVTYDRNDFAMVNATQQVGPGVVNLVTGNLQIPATDASLAAADTVISVGRSFNSRDANAAANGPFGPGWVADVPVKSASAEYTELAISGTTATLTLAGGDTVGFTRTSTSATTFTSELGHEDLALTYVSGSPNRYELKNFAGDVTQFTQPSGSSMWVPTSVIEVGDTIATTYAYETVTVNGQSVTRVTGIMAPQPAGLSGTCSLATPTAVVGCRSLKMTYNASTVTPPSSGQVGDYPHRLKMVEVVAYDPDQTPTPAMRTVAVASYAYDSTGRLAQAWDPRLSTLKTTYTYNTDGQIATVTPPAEEAWTFAYAALSTEAAGTGRLKSVSRPSLLVSPTTATVTLVYRVPVTTAAGGPYDLSSTELARTGQTDLPATATAVFPPTTTATFGAGSVPVPSSYDRAGIHYLNLDGREVNTVDPNGGITTIEHDPRGNVVRALSAANRQRALDQGATAAEEAAIAATLSSVTVYSADGMDVLETFEPEREVTLAGSGDIVRGRAHTTYTYDEGTIQGPYHLLTTTVRGLRVAGEGTDRAGESRTTKTEYGTTIASWNLQAPTASIADATTGGLNLTTRATYTADGQVLTQTLPAGGTATNTAATRVTRYYTAAADSVDAACGLKPAWVGLVCKVGPGGQPTGTALLTSYRTYDMFNQVRVVTEKDGAVTHRTTTTTYDSAARPWKTTMTASTGTALPTTETYYDSNGRITETRSLDALGAITARYTRVYNTLGQMTSYTDADGNTSTMTYDVLGRLVTSYDGKGTQTRTYDGGSERRGLLTSLADTHAGTWTATYGTDGTPTVTWPNGLVATTTVDETGAAVGLAYAATSGCSGVACTVLSERVRASVHGQWLTRASTLSEQAYAYDSVGRLTQVADTVDGSCTTRRYTVDGGGSGNGNRTGLATYAPGTDGVCQSTTAASTVTSTFDAADRITTSGTVYDALGRTTTVPDADALGSGALTAGYYVNDFVRSTAIAGGVTETCTADVGADRIRSCSDTGGASRTLHYSGDMDSPSWIAGSGSTWTRNIAGMTGDLAAVYDSATAAATLQLTNLHGDVIATATTSSTALASTMEATEYGVPRGATGTRYAWLGGKLRAADTPGGLSVMGVRLYNPATGRFLQRDPVYGGNANAYTYPLDPIQSFDLSGMYSMGDPVYSNPAVLYRTQPYSTCLCSGSWSYYIATLAVVPDYFAKYWGGWVLIRDVNHDTVRRKTYRQNSVKRVHIYKQCMYGSLYRAVWADYSAKVHRYKYQTFWEDEGGYSGGGYTLSKWTAGHV